MVEQAAGKKGYRKYICRSMETLATETLGIEVNTRRMDLSVGRRDAQNVQIGFGQKL